MASEFTIISPMNTRLELFGNKYFTLEDVDSQTEINNSISSSRISGADGAKANSVSTDVRSIVITLAINENVDVENAKRYILSYIKSKQTGEYTDNTTHEWSHAIDACRYGYSDIYTNTRLKTVNKASLGI